MKLLGMIAALMIGFGTIANASTIDTPHNETNGILCSTCHRYSLWWQYSPSSQHQFPDHTTIVNTVCMLCHDSGGSAPLAKTHSALVMGSDYHGSDWGIGCTVCHDPHFQGQLAWLGSAESPLLASGTITSVTENSPQENQTTINYTAAINDPAWPAEGDTADDLDWARKNQSGRGLILVQDTTQASNSFMVLSANANQIVINGNLGPNAVDPAYPGNLSTCNSFGLIYGQLIRSRIRTPFSGDKDVKSFTLAGGFVNQDEPATGVCQVCHTETAHFRNTGEINVGSSGLDHTEQSGANCVACHAHSVGFAHGSGGTGQGTGCGSATECHGIQGSHPAHLNPDGMVKATCSVCHNTNNFPTFADGQTTIATTTVCDPCHNDGKGASVDKPEWCGASPPACTACHAASPTTASPTTGSHAKHLSNSWITCANCHSGAVHGATASTQHLDNTIDVYKTAPGDLGYPVDKAMNSAPATCSVAACHGSGTPQWGGSVGCESCHLSASDADDYTFGNSTVAQIGSTEWSYSGHGKTTGTYDISGNPAANLSEAAGSAGPCLYCHDSTVSHGTGTNPFRLANSNALGNGGNDTCLICHGTAGTGYDPDGSADMALKTATQKIDKNHYGSNTAPTTTAARCAGIAMIPMVTGLTAAAISS